MTTKTYDIPSDINTGITTSSQVTYQNKWQNMDSSIIYSNSPTETIVLLQRERARVVEAINVRDSTVERMMALCNSVREKTETISLLRREKDILQEKLDIKTQESGTVTDGITSTQINDEDKYVQEIERLTDIITNLRKVIQTMKSEIEKGRYIASGMSLAMSEPTKEFPIMVEDDIDCMFDKLRLGSDDTTPFRAFRDMSNVSGVTSPVPPSLKSRDSQETILVHDPNSRRDSPFIVPTPAQVSLSSSISNPEDRIQARYSILTALPLPPDIPEDALRPIVIPSPYTLHEFLATMTGPHRTLLGNYRVFQHLTTSWCPEREEHGYFLSPVFKCSTNPRVTTAHRWNVVDMTAKLNKPTECFYNKDGKWYYAGIYRAFALDDLSSQEWENLSVETTQSLIKDTLSARKNTSPQNLYETGQLYAVGALRVACIGLQCIGFNNALYRVLLEQAGRCEMSGRWRGSPGIGAGLWNAPGCPGVVGERTVGGSENMGPE